METPDTQRGRALWEKAQASVERAFEAFAHDKDRPANAPLFVEAIAAMQEASLWGRDHPDAGPNLR